MSYLEEILKKLGWEDGFQIPVANAENQRLEAEVAKLTLCKIKAKNGLETSTNKLENLKNHLKYVTQECEQNQNLITAHVQQLKTEENKLRISQAEQAKYEAEIKQNEKKLGDVIERQKARKVQLAKHAKKLDKLKSETNWDSEALKAWQESLQKRDEDNELIKKFSRQDERKYNELEAKRQNLEMEYVTRKHTIEKMVCDITNYERMLERTGQIMKQQVIEKNALIQQWKDSVTILQQRDSGIDRMQLQIIELHEIVEKELEKLEEHKQFHNNEIRNNNDLQQETQQLNFANSKLRRDLNELQQIHAMLHSQSDTLRRTMLNVAQHLEKERKNKKMIGEKIKKTEKSITNFRTKLNVLKEKKEDLLKSTLSGDERAKHLEKLYDYEQKQQKALNLDAENLQNSFTRVQQELQQQFDIGKMKELEIYGVTTNINHLRKHNVDKKKVLGKRKEDAYELDFKIDEVQRKILINENVIQSDDIEELEGKLLDLENKLGEQNETKNLLKDQVNKIRDDMRRLTTAIANDQDQLYDLKNKLQHENLNFEGGQKQLISLKNQMQEKQVEENVLRLRVNELNKAMKKEQNSIYTMKKYKLSLEQATKERLLEIDTNKEILFVQKRNLSEDKGRLKCDIVERHIKLDQVRKKYSIVLMSLGKDEDGQPLSVVYFKIKNAQEKFLLQQEGDELDTKIKKAEKEILAMENTLKVVNLTNAAFKDSLGAVDDNGKEINEMKRLENNLLMINDKFREYRKKLSSKIQEVKEVRSTLEKVEQNQNEIQEKLIQMEDEYLRIQKEKMLKEEKLERAQKCLKSIDKKISQTQHEKYDRDLEIRQLKDANINVLQRLVEMSIRYQEVAPLIARYTLEYNVRLPEKRSLSSVTSTESTRSLQSCSSKSTKDDDLEKSKSKSESSQSSSLSKVMLTFQV